MNTKLPQAVADYFQAANSQNTDAVFAVFADNALVFDENREYRGAAIRKWSQKVIKEYKPQAEVIDVAESGNKTVVTAKVSGTFPGSPVQLRYYFTLEGEKIAALHIEA